MRVGSGRLVYWTTQQNFCLLSLSRPFRTNSRRPNVKRTVGLFLRSRREEQLTACADLFVVALFNFGDETRFILTKSVAGRLLLVGPAVSTAATRAL